MAQTLRDRGLSGILELDAGEVARQLTIIASRRFCAIRSFELLDQGWLKGGSRRGGEEGGGSEDSRNVRALSELSNQITAWVAETVLYERETRRRAGLLKHIIKIAEKCQHLGNYDTLMAILAALNSTAIERLRRTWEFVPNRSKVTLAELRRITDHSRNYAEYRAKLRATSPPCTPFLGVYLTDLVFTGDGNPDVRRQLIPDKDPSVSPIRIINFDKYAKISAIIRDLQRFQMPYSLTSSPDLQEYLKEMWAKSRSSGDPSILYKASEAIEPREEEPSRGGVGGGGGPMNGHTDADGGPGTGGGGALTTGMGNGEVGGGEGKEAVTV